MGKPPQKIFAAFLCVPHAFQINYKAWKKLEQDGKDMIA
jgi:hypothetical protein